MQEVAVVLVLAEDAQVAPLGRQLTLVRLRVGRLIDKDAIRTRMAPRPEGSDAGASSFLSCFGEPLVDKCVRSLRVGCEIRELPQPRFVNGQPAAVPVGHGGGVDAVAGEEGFSVGVVHTVIVPVGRRGSWPVGVIIAGLASSEVGHLQHGDRLERVPDEQDRERLPGDQHPHDAVILPVGLGGGDGVAAGVGECEGEGFAGG